MWASDWGIIYIECQYHADTPAEFLASFGGSTDHPFCGSSDYRRAWFARPPRVLMTKPRHQIPGVTLTMAMIRELDL